jgi:hypothetical protein
MPSLHGGIPEVDDLGNIAVVILHWLVSSGIAGIAARITISLIVVGLMAWLAVAVDKRIPRTFADYLLWNVLFIFVICSPLVAVFRGWWWWLLPLITALTWGALLRLKGGELGTTTEEAMLALRAHRNLRRAGFDVESNRDTLKIAADYMVQTGSVRPGVQLFIDGNSESAVEEFTRLADDGNAAAKNNLGVVCESHDHLFDSGRNKKEALRWYREAANSGVPMAKVNLAILLSADHILRNHAPSPGREGDFAEAYAFLSEGAQDGVKYAKAGLSDLKKHMTRTEIAAAKEKSGRVHTS